MAIKRKTTTQRKKIIKAATPEIKEQETIEVVKPVTDEDKIFGVKVENVTVSNINYESPLRQYKVHNLLLNNAPVIVSGEFIETFIGIDNLQAREDLKRGKKSVMTKDADGNLTYKIEVI